MKTTTITYLNGSKKTLMPGEELTTSNLKQCRVIEFGDDKIEISGFENAWALAFVERIVIPEGVKRIRKGTFPLSGALKDVVYEGVKPLIIEDGAFGSGQWPVLWCRAELVPDMVKQNGVKQFFWQVKNLNEENVRYADIYVAVYRNQWGAEAIQTFYSKEEALSFYQLIRCQAEAVKDGDESGILSIVELSAGYVYIDTPIHEENKITMQIGAVGFDEKEVFYCSGNYPWSKLKKGVYVVNAEKDMLSTEISNGLAKDIFLLD